MCRRGIGRVDYGISAGFGAMGHLHWDQVDIAWFYFSKHFWRRESNHI